MFSEELVCKYTQIRTTLCNIQHLFGRLWDSFVKKTPKTLHKIAAKSPDPDLVIGGRKDWYRVKEKTPP